MALRTVATAPREAWQSVAVTAGAAASLILDPGARTGPGSSVDGEEEMEETGSGGGGQSGPVGRARVRWKEAQNEMPEVRDSPACLQTVIYGGMLALSCMGGRVKKLLQETQGAAPGRRIPTGGSRRLWGPRN